MADLLDSYVPAKGIMVSRVEKNIAISGRLEIHGDKATAAIATTIAALINRTWTRDFPDGIKIRCRVSVTLRAAGAAADPGAYPIEILDMVNAAAPSYVDGYNTFMKINNLGPSVYTWTVAHEFGHVVKLADRYSESAESLASGMAGGPRTTTVVAGYERNIMGVYLGDLESKNVGDLASGKAAVDTSWLLSDIQARRWIQNNSLSVIDMLSVGGKLKTLKILADGWIAEDDLVAMEKLLKAVTMKSEADLIRKYFSVEQFNGADQRARIRVALSKMP